MKPSAVASAMCAAAAAVEASCLIDDDGNVLWTRCLTCGAPLVRPSLKYRAACRSSLMCFLRFYRNEARTAWRLYRAPK